ncbi:MAG: hypothetical protein JST21_15755 [Bacteroidetes bacterium]|nr:hypothetical protein [Bacteroidota bacterium]
MRLVIALLIFSVSAKAQSFSSLGTNAFLQRPSYFQNIHLNDSNNNSKWSLTHTAAISTSYVFFKGGSAAVIAAPFTLQLNRQLNKNIFAFAAVSAAPAYINFSQRFLSTDLSKMPQNKNAFNANNFGLYTRLEAGLMYVNDAKTFSISGSIGIERSNFPMYPYNQLNTFNPATTLPPYNRR